MSVGFEHVGDLGQTQKDQPNGPLRGLQQALERILNLGDYSDVLVLGHVLHFFDMDEGRPRTARFLRTNAQSSFSSIEGRGM